MRIRLLKDWNGYPAGTVVQVTNAKEKMLLDAEHAEPADKPRKPIIKITPASVAVTKKEIHHGPKSRSVSSNN